MNTSVLNKKWKDCLQDLTGIKYDYQIIDTLSLQTIDSIRRIKIYQVYKQQAIIAEKKKLVNYHTSNPLVLCQRQSISRNSKIWIIYLATYFGKSKKSNWTLFRRAAFNKKKEFIKFESISKDKFKYYSYINSFDFFANANFSNHRKYTKKSISGRKGIIRSVEYVLNNISEFSCSTTVSFDTMYKRAFNIPNFGRMATFDFVCMLCKCGMKVEEPLSMYHKHSTGPLKAIEQILMLAGINSPTKEDQIIFGNELLSWFRSNTEISMIAQVLEDAICNWQKSPSDYNHYFG